MGENLWFSNSNLSSVSWSCLPLLWSFFWPLSRAAVAGAAAFLKRPSPLPGSAVAESQLRRWVRLTSQWKLVKVKHCNNRKCCPVTLFTVKSISVFSGSPLYWHKFHKLMHSIEDFSYTSLNFASQWVGGRSFELSEASRLASALVKVPSSM